MGAGPRSQLERAPQDPRSADVDEDGGGGVAGGIAGAGFSAEMGRDLLRLTQEWIRLGYEGVREMGDEPSAYVSYVQWPPPDGQSAKPQVFPRRQVAETLKHLQGTEKYAQLLEHLEGTPCDDVMLALDIVGRDGICVMFRDKDMIPPYEVGGLKLTRADEEG